MGCRRRTGGRPDQRRISEQRLLFLLRLGLVVKKGEVERGALNYRGPLHNPKRVVFALIAIVFLEHATDFYIAPYMRVLCWV